MDVQHKADKVTKALNRLVTEYRDEAAFHATPLARKRYTRRLANVVQEAANTLPVESKARLYDILTGA